MLGYDASFNERVQNAAAAYAEAKKTALKQIAIEVQKRKKLEKQIVSCTSTLDFMLLVRRHRACIERILHIAAPAQGVSLLDFVPIKACSDNNTNATTTTTSGY